MELKDCTISINEEGKRITVVYNDYLHVAGKLPEKIIETDELIIDTIERFNQWAAKYDANCSKDDLKVLGLHLYRLLFNEEIRSKFNKAVENAEKKESNLKLRLKLIFEESAKRLSLLPWEFIFLPDNHESLEGEFLAEKTDLILTRFLPLPNLLKLAPEPNDTPVRLLIVSAHPSRSNGKPLGTIVDDDFIDYIIKLKSKNIVVKHLADPNFKQLQEFILGKDEMDGKKTEGFYPHIFHFVGHGEAGKIALKKTHEDIYRSIPSDERHLVNINQQDDAEWIGGTDLTDIFKTIEKPKFVFLNACKAAKSEIKGYRNLSNSIALELANAKIPAVLAMQYEISNDDASNFAKKVYSDIIAGLPIDSAVKNGILELGSKIPVWNHPRFGIPVFYLGANDTTFIIAKPEAADENKKETDAKPAGSQIKCPTCSKYFNGDFPSCPYCRSKYIYCSNSDCNTKVPLPTDANYCPFCDKAIEDVPVQKVVDEDKRQAAYKNSSSRDTGNIQPGKKTVDPNKVDLDRSDLIKKVNDN